MVEMLKGTEGEALGGNIGETPSRLSRTPSGRAKSSRRAYLKSGVFGVKRRLKDRGIKALDGRSTAARAVKEWRAECEQDLGGTEALSRQQQTVLDMASAAVFLLGVIDAFVGAHPELLVNKRKRSVAPVVRERIAVADHLGRLLGMLGLERKAKPVPSLASYLAGRTLDAPKPAATESTPPAGPGPEEES